MELLNNIFLVIRMAEEENMEWDEEQLKEKETTIMQIGKMYRDDGNAKDLENMIKKKARTSYDDEE